MNFELNIANKTVNGIEVVKASATEKNAVGMDIAANFLQMQQQYKMFHWQVFSFAQHKAFDGIYDSLIGHTDKFMETFMGKYGRPKATSSGKLIAIANLEGDNFKTVTDQYIDFLSNKLPINLSQTDTDLLNVRDEILGDLNQLKYLLTLV